MTPEIDPRAPRDDVTVRTRAGDGGWWSCVRAWWDEWGNLIKGVCAIAAAIACIIYAPLVYDLQRTQSSQQKATAVAAKVSCQRSRTLGPKLADYYARDPLFPQDVLAEYRRTIPKTCPK